MSYKDILLDELNNKLHLGLDDRPLSIEEQIIKQEIIHHRLSMIDFPFHLLIKTISQYQEPRRGRKNA